MLGTLHVCLCSGTVFLKHLIQNMYFSVRMVCDMYTIAVHAHSAYTSSTLFLSLTGLLGLQGILLAARLHPAG